MLPLCLLYLGLNFLAKPTYVWVFLPLSEIIVAWYITPYGYTYQVWGIHFSLIFDNYKREGVSQLCHFPASKFLNYVLP